MKKKKWFKPKLVVLVKGNPAENVLTGCKGLAGGADGGTISMEACTSRETGSQCGSCDTTPVS